MSTTALTLTIQRLLMQVTGGACAGRTPYDPGPDLHHAYASGTFEFHCIGPPCKEFVKKLPVRVQKRQLLCRLRFDFRTHQANIYNYEMIEFLVRKYCQMAREHFSDCYGDGDGVVDMTFSYAYQATEVNTLMIEFGNPARALTNH
jgi:hypothetical protein